MLFLIFIAILACIIYPWLLLVFPVSLLYFIGIEMWKDYKRTGKFW